VLPYTPDAEDACQEALINVATKIGGWAGQGRFTTWLHVVAVNSARSTYRRMRNQAVASDVLPQEKPDPRTTSVIAGTRLDLLDALETLERAHPQYVEPLLLRDVYGLPYDEIADQVGAPLGTVKAQVHHGRKLVRPLLRGPE
jgi:RNA polymerase sigma-70 factor (ECF subfamily)